MVWISPKVLKILGIRNLELHRLRTELDKTSDGNNQGELKWLTSVQLDDFPRSKVQEWWKGTLTMDENCRERKYILPGGSFIAITVPISQMWYLLESKLRECGRFLAIMENKVEPTQSAFFMNAKIGSWIWWSRTWPFANKKGNYDLHHLLKPQQNDMWEITPSGSSWFIQNPMNTNKLCYSTKNGISNIIKPLKFPAEIVSTKYRPHTHCSIFINSQLIFQNEPKSHETRTKGSASLKSMFWS